jgi:Na+-driven multidrug efflux pump
VLFRSGYAVIGRIVPLAFGAVFALSGSIGPIFGQNLGARRFDRLRRTVTDSLAFTLAYCLVVWAILVMLREPIVQAFGIVGTGADLVRFFCVVVAGTFLFLGALFVANATFNNLGFPTWSTLFNLGRATLGTVPFVWLGGRWFGAEVVIAGQALGGVVFGVAAVAVSYRAVAQLAARHAAEAAEAPVLSAQPIPPLSSDKAATAIDWSDAAPEDDMPPHIAPER